ncbi:PAS domain S-box protein [Massilia sp. W12]|uniref:PAS domain S-box protein n=1 Tax=Massilia sp. W12 TaxID=3126507 RepID=UPI0030CEBDE1
MGLTVRQALLLALLLGLLLPGVLIGSVQIMNLQQDLQEESSQEEARQLDSLVTLLRAPLWDINEQEVREVTRIFMGNRNLLKLSLTPQAPTPAWIKVELQQSHAAAGATRVLQQAIQHNQQTLALLRLEFDQGHLRQRIWERTLASVLLLAGLLAACMLSLLLLAHFGLLRPLRRLSEQAGALAGHDANLPLEVWRGKDEISQLGRSINGARQQIAALLGTLEANNARLMAELGERRRIEKEQERQSAYFKAILDQMPQGISVFDEAQRLRYWNQGFAALVGEDVPLQQGCSAQQLGLDEVPQSGQSEQLHEDGRTLLLEARQVNMDEQLCAWIITYTDISSGKESEKRAAAAARKFSSVFQSMPEGVSVHREADGEILEVNEGFELLTGWTHQQALGKTPLQLGIWQDNAERARFRRELATHHVLRSYEAMMVRKDGSSWRASISAVVTDIDGEAVVVAVLRDVTLMRQQESDLRTSRERLAAMLRVFPEFLTISRFDTGEFLEVNEGFTHITGWRRDQALGRTSIDLQILSQSGRANLLAQMVERGGVLRDAPLTLRRKDGGMVEVSWTSSLFALDGAQYIVAIARDVSQIRMQEQELRLSQQRLAAMLRAFPEFLTISRYESGEFLEVNEGFTHITGWQRAEALGRTSLELQIWDEAGRTRLLEDMQKHGGMVRGQDISLRCKDGNRVEVSWSSAIFAADDSRYIVAIARDVTQIRKQEQALRHSRERLAAMFRAFPEFLTISLMEDGRFLEVNDGFEALTGWRREQALGKTSVQLGIWDGDARDRMLAEMRKQGGVLRGLDVNLRRCDGSSVAVSWSSAMFDLNGEAHLISMARDMTGIRQQEQALRNSLARQQAAEDANQMKNEFLAMISHEVRTPLGGVIGMLRFALKDVRLLADTRAKLEIGLRNAEILLQIINDILDYSKLEAGKMVIEKIDFDLPALVRDVEAILIERAEAKSLQLQIQMRAPLGRWWRGDPTRVRQVLVNLLGNAIKFTHEGWVSLTVREVVDDGLEFVVEDSGIGIDAAILPRLFRKFEQADVSTARRFGGTGLGLAICKLIVDAMGGQINVDSEVGQGTQFTVWLPLLHGKEVAHISQQDGDGRHPCRLRVLCAEDGPTNQIIIRELVQGMGHQIDVVEDGLYALQALAAQDYDLVLMDSRMPRMDGLQALRHIRNGEHGVRKRKIPVIALTANVGAEERARFMSAGANGFLGKPVDEALLHSAIGQEIANMLAAGVSLSPAPPPQLEIADLDALFEIDTSAISADSGDNIAAPAVPAADGFSPAARMRMRQAFLQDGPRQLQQMEQALQAQDWPQLALHAHSLKGSAGYFGAHALQAICKELEAAADAGKQEAAQEWMQRFAPELSIVIQRMQQEN